MSAAQVATSITVSDVLLLFYTVLHPTLHRTTLWA